MTTPTATILSVTEYQERIRNIYSSIDKASVPNQVSPTIVAVSKTYPPEAIMRAYQAGMRHFGENRVPELAEKATALTAPIILHFIGRLQSNKIRNLLKIPGLKYIHSVHSLEILEFIYKTYRDNSTNIDSPLYYFLQVNTSAEDQKAGFDNYSDIAQCFQRALELQSGLNNLQCCGLMTMGKIRTDDLLADAHHCFSLLQSYRTQLERTYAHHIQHPLQLSMGMSQDYLVATQHQSSFLRIGSAIFEK
ncbi:MAG: YggS family pyridoxal phosphate-dependent enzyme [Oligoflexia bacterium]|nr:YggS family pyridoxal phosphate-dependent enzyme [Oligoflexia bacterium]